MIKNTKLQRNREIKIRPLLNVVPDWAYVTGDAGSINMKWTTPRGVWAVNIQFPFIGGERDFMKVSGRGLDASFDNFDDDDLTGIIALLSAQGAVKVQEEE